MKTAVVLIVTMAAVHPFTASAETNAGPVELNAASLDAVTAGQSSVVRSATNLAQRALIDVLGRSVAPGSAADAFFNNPSRLRTNNNSSNNDDDSQSNDRPRRSAADVLAEFNGASQQSSVPTSPASSTPVIVNLPAAQLEYIRNLPGTGLSVIEPLARGGQYREFVHHQFQNHR